MTKKQQKKPKRLRPRKDHQIESLWDVRVEHALATPNNPNYVSAPNYYLAGQKVLEYYDSKYNSKEDWDEEAVVVSVSSLDFVIL